MRPTLYTADWILPVSAGPIADGGVLVDEHGRIAAVATAGNITAGDDVLRVDLGPAILLPGLINVHAHPDLAAMRGLLEDLPFHSWIPALRRVREAAAGSSGDFAAAARWSCVEAISAGITTLASTEDSGASLDAFREAGVRGIIYREVFGPAPGQAGAALAALRERVEAMRPLETELVRIGISPHAPYTVSDELFGLAAAWAITEKLPVAVHIAESEAESQLVCSGDGPFAGGLRTRGIETRPRAASPVQLLERTGVLDTRPLLIHAVRLADGDVRRIADSGAAVAHCPTANARLGHGVAPAVELLEAGVTLGLGTDSVAANNRMDILEEARTAQLMQRALLRSAGALPPQRLLRLATIDGARALGLDDRVGTLEVGKEADLCAVRVDRAHTWPVNDPVAALFLSARGSDVVLTAVRGAVLFRNGEVLSLDTSRLREQVMASADRMRAARDRR